MNKANKITLLVLIIVCSITLMFSLLEIDWTVFETGKEILKEFRQVVVLIGLIALFVYHYLPFIKDKGE